MKRLIILLLALAGPSVLFAQSPGVGLDALPVSGSLSGAELLFGYQSGTGGSGATVCARGWCPVSITPAQIATFIATGGSLVLPVTNGGTGQTSFAAAGLSTFTGSIVSGHCAQFSNTTGTIVDAGAACGTGGGGGGVSTFSFTNGGGFTGSVTNPTTTPALSLIPSFTGIGYSDGTQFLAAIAANFPTLNQSTTGNAATATALAANPTLCGGGQAAGGVLASGNATGCFTPTGSGTVNSGTSGTLAYYAATGSAVSPATVGAGLTNNAGNLTVTQAVNAQTGTTYAIVAGDATKLLTFNNASPVAASIAQAGTTGFGSGYALDVQNIGAGTVTITPATSTINGASTLTVAQNLGCSITSDGTNYQVSACTAVAPAGSGSVNVQEFTSTGTWTKPGTGTTVHVIVCGGGGGGGSGAAVASGTAVSGGGGGGGGECGVADFPISAFGGTVAVTIGAGGTAGASSATAPGSNGTEGGNSTFGTFLTGFGGGRGGGGGSAADSHGGGGGGIQGPGFNNGTNGGPCAGAVTAGAPAAMNCGAAGGSNNNGATGGTGTNGGASGFGGAGGAAGGGVTTGPAGSTAGTGGSAWATTIAGGANSGGAGNPPTGYGCGSGGGGTPGVTSGNSAAGGAGGRCAGGGGSGAALTANSSGAGGLGGTGYAVITVQ